MAAQSDSNVYISCILNKPSWTLQDRQLYTHSFALAKVL